MLILLEWLRQCFPLSPVLHINENHQTKINEYDCCEYNAVCRLKISDKRQAIPFVLLLLLALTLHVLQLFTFALQRTRSYQPCRETARFSRLMTCVASLSKMRNDCSKWAGAVPSARPYGSRGYEALAASFPRPWFFIFPTRWWCMVNVQTLPNHMHNYMHIGIHIHALCINACVHTLKHTRMHVYILRTHTWIHILELVEYVYE